MGFASGEVDCPQICDGRTCAREDDDAIKGDVDGVGMKVGCAAVVAEESNGEERA